MPVDLEIAKRKKELDVCFLTVDFFLESPWEDEYSGIEKRAWFLFLQSRFPDENGDWFTFNLQRPKNFLINIQRRILEEIQGLSDLQTRLREDETLAPSIPPNLPELVEAWEEEEEKREREKAIKKSLTEQIKAARKAINAQWEIKRHEQLIKRDIEPKTEHLQKEIGFRVETFAGRFSQLSKTSDEISKALSEIPKEKLTKALEEDKLKEEVLKPAIIKGLESKGKILTDEKFEETFGLTKEEAEALGAGKFIEDVADDLAHDQEVIQNFHEQTALFELKDFTQKRKEYLEKKAEDPKYETTESFQDAQNWAQERIQEYVGQILTQEPVFNDLIKKLGLKEEKKLYYLLFDISNFIYSKTFLAQDPNLFAQSEEDFTESIKKAIFDAFEYNLRRPAIRNIFSALINSIPFLRTAKAKAAQEIAENVKTHLESPENPPPPSMISAIKAATISNSALAEESIEAGNPLGRLPYYVLRNITVMLPEDQIQTITPGAFVEEFRKGWKKKYKTEKGFSVSQQAAIQKYVEFLQKFQRTNPAAFKLFYWHQKHLIPLSWGKMVGGYFLRYPDYLLHFPYIFGKYAFQVQIAQRWEYEWKPKVFGKILEKAPIFGKILTFIYKKDEWSVYQGPIKRLKSKVQKFVFQKVIGGTGRLLQKLGKKLGKTALGKILTGWGEKLIFSAATGGIGALIFAFYPFFKRILKFIAGFLGLVTLGILHWAATYGPGALIGWGLGTIGGAVAGIKVGTAVFSATFPFLGPFAIIPAVAAGGLTWLASQAVGTALGILAIKIWLGIQGAVSSLFGGPAVAEAAGMEGIISSATELTPNAIIPAVAPVGMSLLTAVTIFITSSAFVYPGVGRVTPYGACGLTDVYNKNGGTELARLFIDAGQWAGIPPAVLAGVAKIEGGHLWEYTDDEIREYSAPEAKERNCQTSTAGARGPMQFMPDQWEIYKNAAVLAGVRKQDYLPEICNILDSVYAAALKLKQDSGTGPENTCNWNKETVYKAARSYYGACKTFRTDIPDYCEFVWEYYLAHSVSGPVEISGAFFWQSDPRWRNYGWYPDCTVGNSGCGPASMAIIFKSFGVETDPTKMWDEFVADDYITRDICLSQYEAFTKIPQKHGFESIYLGTDWDQAEQYLKNGYLLIAATYLHGGHILVVVKIEGNTLTTFDPAYSNGEGRPYTKNGLNLGGGFWAIKKVE